MRTRSGGEDLASHLVLEGRCPECGGPYKAGIWDHSHVCEFCASLLLFGRRDGGEVWVVAESPRPDDDVRALRIDLEVTAHLTQNAARAQSSEGISVDLTAMLDPDARCVREELERTLHLVERVDLYAPYEIREQTIFQSILGRKSGGPKETYLQSFQAEEIARLYDASEWNLRDRGLKIHGFRLRPIEQEDIERAGGRFLEMLPEAEVPEGLTHDRSKFRLRPGSQIINRVTGTGKGRRLRVWKRLTYAAFEGRGGVERLLFDRQFQQIAGRLDKIEAQRLLGLEPRHVAEIVHRPEVRAISADCPNCGWEMRVPSQENVVFCSECLHAVAVNDKALRLVRYQVAARPEDADAEDWLWFPFWTLPFRVAAEGRRFERIWDWLEAVSPQERARNHMENDPESSLLYLPARNLHGTEELDDAWCTLTGWVNWRQPALRPERPTPDPRRRVLGVDVTPSEAQQMARFALIALHDVSSTRRLNGRNFKSLIADSELDPAHVGLVAVPLPIRVGRFRPPGMRPVDLKLLLSDGETPRIVRSFSLN